MYKNKTILATICARGGSKGVKGKNIRLLAGKPLICYSLDLIRQGKLVDDYIVSTDSEEIMDVVRNYGFEIRFKRPAELAGDKVTRIDAIRHAVQWVGKNLKKEYAIIVDLGVATPLKNADDLDNMVKTLVDTNASNVLSVNPSHRNPYFNMVEVIQGKIVKVKAIETSFDTRQVAPQVYDMNDAFNAFSSEVLYSDHPQFNDKTNIYIMPRERSVDIDEELDFQIAETIIKTGCLSYKWEK